MSNEELVSAIQAGENLWEELWGQVSGLIRWKANQIITILDGRGGVTVEDLCQSGYLAMVDAINTFDSTNGHKFSNWLMLYLKTAFAEAAGYRTQKDRKEPLNNYVSLDLPISGDPDSDRLVDVLADPTGLHWQETVEEDSWQKQLHDALECALGEIPTQYSQVLRLRYYHGMTFDKLSQEQGISREQVRQMEEKGIRLLRKPSVARRLRPFYDFDFYCGTGLQAFLNSGLSIQERYLIRKEEQSKN